MNRYLLMVMALVFTAVSLKGQTNLFPASGSAGINTTAPDPSAALDIVSPVVPQGLLVPRMNLTQRNNIVSPATGLLIYQTNSTPGFYYYTGTAWTPVTPAAGATRSLNNLTATSINQDLLPSANNSRNLGSATLRWKTINLYNLKFSDGSTQSTAAKIYTPGTGISFAGSVINNAAPDQTVTITGAGSTTVTGTYPNFNISSPVVSGGWSLSGNAGTTDGVDFIGTTDNVPLNFRVNNLKAGRIDNSGIVFLGYQSGNNNISNYNTGVGYRSLFSNTTGGLNTAIGYQSLYANIDGISNTATGHNSLYYNSAGSYNTATGSSALYMNTGGNQNTAIGNQTLFLNINGQSNTASGANAMNSNTNGNQNTASGVSALGLNTIGNSNAALGFAALYSNTNGVGNTAIGTNADVLSGALVNATAIGYNAKVGASNAMVLGGTGADQVNVGIGTTNPTARLEVMGSVKITDGSQGVGKVLTSDANGLATWATIVVPSSGWLLTGNAGTTDGVNFIGTTDNIALNFKVNNQKAGKIDQINGNTFLGYQTGNVNTGTSNTGIGNKALYNNTSGFLNSAFGEQALFNNTIGFQNTAIGRVALFNNTSGQLNTALGSEVLYFNSTGNNNSGFGWDALFNNSTGNNNSAVGIDALFGNTTGSNNVAMGMNTLTSNTTGDFNTAIGYGANVSSGALTNATAIGANANVSSSNCLVLGNNANVGIGTTAPTAKLEIIGAIKITDGTQAAGRILTSDASGLASWTTNSNWSLSGNAGTVDGTNFIGTTDNVPLNFRMNNQKAGRIDNSLENTMFGFQAGNSITSGYDNTVVGFQALYLNATGFDNTATGPYALFNNSTGHDNTASGLRPLYSNTSGDLNTATGSASLYSNTTGSNNAGLGVWSLFSNTTGNYNTAVGLQALYNNTTGNNNTAIGYGADVNSGGLSNATAIGYNAKVSTSNSLILGNNANVGIGTSAPTSKLEIIGSIKIADGTQAAGRILTSDAFGLASWTANSSWSLNGNAGTIDGTNFIGTTDNIPLNFKVNNQKAGKIDQINGNTFLGYQTGNANTSTFNSAVGYKALYNNTTGASNSALGDEALYNNTIGNQNTALGRVALYFNTSGQLNTALGSEVLYFNSTGNNNSGLGWDALFNNSTGNNNSAVGFNALFGNTTGSNNVAMGMNSLTSNSTGDFNTALGYGANVTTGALTNATAIGANANVSSSNCLVLGNNANVGIGTTAPTVKLEIIGAIKITDGTQAAGRVLTSDASGLASWTANSSWSVNGNAGTIAGTNFIGTTDNVPLTFKVNNFMSGKIDNNLSNAFFGYQSGFSNTSGSGNSSSGCYALALNTTGYSNTASGFASLSQNTTGYQNTSNGVNSLYSNTAGYENVAIGNYTLFANTNGYQNTATGGLSLRLNSTGSQNTAAGYRSLYSNVDGNDNTATGANSLTSNTYGELNSAVGYYALAGNTTGGNNTALGVNALYSNTIGGSNTAVGGNALTTNISGYNNLAIGYAADVASGGLTNASAIGYNAKVSTSNSIVLGGTGADQVKVGIGTTAPSANLDIFGSVKIADGTQGAGKILTSDANGLVSWVSYYNWTLNGNSGTIDGTNFLGTTDNVALNFRMNNQKAGRVDTDNRSTFYGYQSANGTSTAAGNTAIGYKAMFTNSAGTDNTVTGREALFSNSSGYQMLADGAFSLYQNSTGRFNTASGYHTLYANTTGNFNTALGWSADVSSGSLSNATAIGNSAVVDASDKVRIGNSSVLSNGGQVGWSTYSDARIKDQVQENVPGMEFIDQLRPVTYHYNVAAQNKLEGISDTAQWEGKYDIEKIQFTGFIAQEVDAAAQKIQYDFSGVDKSGTLMALRYSDFVVPLVKAAQELDSVNQNQSAEMAALQAVIHDQQSEIDALKDQLALITANTNSGNLLDGTVEVNTNSADEGPMLGQNIPNPYNNSTLIPFRIPKNCMDASIMIANVGEGRVITVVPISCNETHISFDAGNLASGTYTYSLIVDGLVVGTRQMTLTK